MNPHAKPPLLERLPVRNRALVTALLRILILLCLALGAREATAAVQPVVLFINGIITSYTVPTGKVLLIEQLSGWAAGNTPISPRIIVQTKIVNIANGGTLTTDWGFAVTDKSQTVTLTRPLRIPAGGIVGIDYSGNIAYNEVHMMGLLIDAADLYAANIGGSVERVALAGGELGATVALASPRPARITSSTSSDLATWSPNATEQKQHGPKPAEWTVQTAAAGNKEFLKVAARAPETVPGVSP